MSRVKEALGAAKGRVRLIGAGAAVVMLVGLFVDPEQFFQSYLLAYLFWLGLGLGCLAVYMLNNLTGGGWGLPIRRGLEAGVRTLPLLGLMFLPIIAGAGRIYAWADADAVAHDAVLQHKAPYLNVPFFIVRAIFFFAIWIALSRVLLKLSARYEKTGDPDVRHKRAAVSAAGLLLYVLTMTFASVDWGMSVEAHWFSTIYGLLFIVGQVIAALCLTLVVASRFFREEPAKSTWTRDQFNDCGNLLLAFVMLWAYMAFSQFLIIWSGNLPEETPWYLSRTHAGWQVIAALVIVFHFVVPFLLLLARRNKRNTRVLARICAGLLLVRFVDLYWMLVPGFHPHTFHVSWMDIVAVAALGGFWLWHFAHNVKSAPVLVEPPPEPGYEEAPAS